MLPNSINAAGDGLAEADISTAASESGTPAASQVGSGNAASALEAFLDNAAQPSSKRLQSAPSYSR